MRSSSRIPDVRNSATPSPVKTPQTNPAADRIRVHCRPLSRKRNSPVPISLFSLDRVLEIAGGDEIEDQHHHPGHYEVHQRDRSVDFETAEGVGFNSLRDRG